MPKNDQKEDGKCDVTCRKGNMTLIGKKFLFIHQSDFQKQLLLKYGQEICLMDATYRTTQYAVPLYFICVPTNVNYMTVATFITETEDSDSIKRVLLQLRQWNPEWNPSFFMCDYATEEINAIESVFPDSFVYLCDFHREQAWDRWLNASHNGVQLYKSQILSLLRNIATASTEMEFEEAKDNLKESALWRGNKKFRDWFERYWLSKSDNFDIWSWESLPILYRKSPFLNLDIQLENVDNRQFVEETVDAELADSEAYLSTADFIELPISSAAKLFERNTSESTAHVIESVVNEDFVIYEATAISEESEVRTLDEGEDRRIISQDFTQKDRTFGGDSRDRLEIGTFTFRQSLQFTCSLQHVQYTGDSVATTVTKNC
ncbi:unnamed protein product [Mytilus edulis]|uniref:ZSWIM1/3 RNaseH-like domain-containing protein n=1 Tax=Mytilus edulis TaxID=6550 RepID=A0A8S3QDB9_MYTED|nr:unnamed protein product [Mytilus edulis]